MANFTDLTNSSTPFPTYTFGQLDSNVYGLQLDPRYPFQINIDLPRLSGELETMAQWNPFSALGISEETKESMKQASANIPENINSISKLLSTAKEQQAGGAVLKMAASAGRLFTDLLAAGGIWENIHAQEYNTKLSADVQMAALDNQILYFKNQIADRFNKTMARNAVTMAAKNLRVTAGNLLEQTKEEAYDATQDIATFTSNAELQKILLRSQQKQADVAAKLMKSNVVTDMISDLADLGLMVGTKGGTFAKDWGTLFSGTQFDDTYKSIYKTANEAYDWTAGQLTSAKNWFKDTFKIKGIQND